MKKLFLGLTLAALTASSLLNLRAAAAPAETTHKVSTGQNPTTIARRYGVKISDLYKWNNWPKNHVLQVGDTVVIRKG